MKLEDHINRFFIRIVMGGKHLQPEEPTKDPSPEAMGSLKKFFAWGLEELKKDILKKKEKADD